MARIVVENQDREQVVIETTTLDHSEGISPDGTIFRLAEFPPTNLPGERWDQEDGETYWRI